MQQSLGIEFDKIGARRSILESATDICFRKSEYGVYQWSLHVNVYDGVCGSLTVQNYRYLNK